jgi:hypothetical protein
MQPKRSTKKAKAAANGSGPTAAEKRARTDYRGGDEHASTSRGTYCRNSNGGGITERQREWARAAVQREGVERSGEFAEPAKRGLETAARPAFRDVLDICQQGARRRDPVRGVPYWHTNRFSRSHSQETAWFIRELRMAGVGRMLTTQRWYDFSRMEGRVISNIERDTTNPR